MDRTPGGHADDVALAMQLVDGPPPGDSGVSPTNDCGRARLAGGRLPVADVPDFPVIYETHFDFVWRTARRLGVAEKSLDDAAQDVFIIVHRKLSEFEGRSSLKSWIFGIARRVAHDYRRQARRKERGNMPTDGLIDMRGESPRENAARAEAMRVLYEFLDSLDGDKREAFILAELEQMTVPEIADAVGANINTIYSRLRAARRAFDQAVGRLRAKQARTEQRKATP